MAGRALNDGLNTKIMIWADGISIALSSLRRPLMATSIGEVSDRASYSIEGAK